LSLIEAEQPDCFVCLVVKVDATLAGPAVHASSVFNYAEAWAHSDPRSPQFSGLRAGQAPWSSALAAMPAAPLDRCFQRAQTIDDGIEGEAAPMNMLAPIRR
jgi:hypothetical protein